MLGQNPRCLLQSTAQLFQVFCWPGTSGWSTVGWIPCESDRWREPPWIAVKSSFLFSDVDFSFCLLFFVFLGHVEVDLLQKVWYFSTCFWKLPAWLSTQHPPIPGWFQTFWNIFWIFFGMLSLRRGKLGEISQFRCVAPRLFSSFEATCYNCPEILVP